MISARTLRLIFITAVFGQLAPPSGFAQSSGESLSPAGIEKATQAVVMVEIPEIGQGSGFLVDSAGTVVTNFHVIAGAKEATVRFHDDSTVEVAGFTAVSVGRDLVALRLAPTKERRPYLKIADAEPAAGERVVIIGSPRSLRGTVSDGIVSAARKGSEVRAVLKQTMGDDVYSKVLGYDQDVRWIQTSAPISPGNSGGPVLDSKGRVVAVATWSHLAGQNLNFAVSAFHVTELIAEATERAKPFDELPAAKPQVLPKGKSDGTKTLTFWNRRRELMGELGQGLPSFKGGKTVSKKIFAQKLARLHEASLTFGVQLRELDVVGVDPELIRVALAESQCEQQLLRAMIAFNGSATESQVRRAEATVTRLADDLSELQTQFDELRIQLSQRYGIEFPPHTADLPDTPDDKDSKPKQPASNQLRLAKSLLNAGKRDAAKERLTKLESDFPGSPEAIEARKLIDELTAGEQ